MVDFKKTEKGLYQRKTAPEKLKTILRHPVRKV